MTILIDGNGKALKEGDKVYIFDHDDGENIKKYFGTLYKNKKHPEVSDWYIRFNDNKKYAVLVPALVYKA